jgi:hypothetical protein
MVHPDVYRQMARQCRALLRVTRNPELIAQLETWAVECDRRADRDLRTKPSDDIRERAKRYQVQAAEYQAVADQLRDQSARASFHHLAQTYEAMARRLEARAERKTRQISA